MKILGFSHLSYPAMAFLIAVSMPSSVGAADPEKHITPKCYTQIDPDNRRFILMVCDFSGVSIAEKIIDLKAHVEVTDSSGKKLGSQVLLFADEKQTFHGGRKYSREFEHGIEKLPASAVTVKISSAEAVVVPEVNAISH